MLKEGLSLLCKTGNGLAHAYVRLDVKEKELTEINILRSFIHLRYVDISINMLRDISPLNCLTSLLWLNADQNQLTSAHMEDLPYLQIASFAQNHIKDMGGISHPRLEKLTLIGNMIASLLGMEFRKLMSLHTLELRGNHLESTAGVYLPNLRNLYLAQNTLRRLEGLEVLVNLTTLHLRDNQLETLDGFSEHMRALQYVNIRGNLVASVKEMEKLQCLPMLRALVLLENPCAEEEDYRSEAIIALPQLERLDKEFFEAEEKLEAEETRKARQEEAALATVGEVGDSGEAQESEVE
ncbi:leucine-rich repeat-containing protein 23 isoform X2 [Ambystoma mexicanum]